MILKWIKTVVIFWFLLSVFTGCNNTENIKNVSFDELFKGVPNVTKHAQFFRMYVKKGVSKIVVLSPFGNDSLVYFLVDSVNYKKYSDLNGVVEVPLKRAVVLSSTQLDAVLKLNALDKVKGISDAKFITNEKVINYLNSGKLQEISAGNNFFTEKAILLKPDAVFFSPYKKDQLSGGKTPYKKIPFFDFMETSPLGRTEWIKFSAAFFGEIKKAEQIFDSIESRYNLLKSRVEYVKIKPTVFSGKYFNGQWYVPGGKSYMAQIFKDAGADYIFKNNNSVNSVAFDFEVVFKRAADADFWRILGGVDTSSGDFYENLKKQNPLYSNFKAFKERKIIYCNPFSTAYFERSALMPDVVLADFIYAFHPEILPDYKPVFYKLLK